MHTPTPWKVDAYGQILTDPISGSYETICTTPKAWIDNKLATHDHKGEATEMLLRWSQRATDNAALIVTAVNAHAAMKEALKDLLAYIGQQDTNIYGKIIEPVRKARAAIALAEGKE